MSNYPKNAFRRVDFVTPFFRKRRKKKHIAKNKALSSSLTRAGAHQRSDLPLLP